jgi:DNA-binding NarL/FixJ family response regulator
MERLKKQQRADENKHIEGVKMIHILLVDDSPEYRELLKTSIDLDKELEVISMAGDGYEALSHCEISLPDLVIMDLNMDKCNGIKGTKLIKERFPSVKVMVMTGLETEQNLYKALEAGADGFFLKGVETPKLRQAIKNIINGVQTINTEIFIP